MMKKHHVWLGLTMMMILATLGSSALRAEDNSTPQQVFDGMRESFKADKAKGVHARYQWELSGPNGGEWWIVDFSLSHLVSSIVHVDPPFAAIRAAKFPLITRVHAFRFVGLEPLAHRIKHLLRR